ncbi:MAG: ribonuclease III family protein [Clostridia bacterium]|nr:ribonuclease III family protein [Clostridia bacterium]
MKNKSPVLCPTDDQLAAIEETIGYAFRNRTLLRQAFTRRSFTNEYEAQHKRPAPVECNEVLETIGDSVLSTALLTILTERHGKVTGRGYESDFREGVFTEIKKNLCDKTALSRIIDELKTADGTPFAALQATGNGDHNTGNYNSKSPKEDLFESILGAVALDCGTDFSVIVPLVERLDNPDRLTVEIAEKDPITRLKEYCEAREKKLECAEIERTGPDHDPTHTVEYFVDGKFVSRGSGRSKKDAKREASREALNALGANE